MTAFRKCCTMCRPLFLAGGIALAAVRCSEAPAPAATAGQDNAMTVFVTIPPLASVVERIAGERARVDVLVEQGRDPHTFEPAPRQMAALAKASLLCTAGAPFEDKLAAKAKGGAERLSVVDTSEGIADEPREDHANEGGDHVHGHHEDGVDPHVWLAPKSLDVMARNVYKTLAGLDPAHTAEYEANLAAFLADLDAVDRRIRAKLAPFEGRAFYVFHPAFGHFAEAYGLCQKAIETGGREPSAGELQALIKAARADHARAVFVQPQHGTGSAETIARAIGADLVILDPLERDVLANIERAAARIEQALKP